MAKIIIFLKKNLAVAAIFHLGKIAIPSVGIERVGSNFVGRHKMYVIKFQNGGGRLV